MVYQLMNGIRSIISRQSRDATAVCIGAALALALACPPAATAGDQKHPHDRHYNGIGFFDIHVCNWPERAPFFMPLFSTPRFNDIEAIEVSYPDGRRLTRLDLARYRIIPGKQQAEKHVFIKQLDVPPDAPDGWYSARVVLRSGEIHMASDYVVVSRLPRAGGQVPADDVEVPAPPARLAWAPVPGAGFYEVFIRDQWDDDRLIFKSKLLDRPELALPEGLIQPGGLYSWTIHARDVNEDTRLGDFNRGSMSAPAAFSVADGG